MARSLALPVPLISGACLCDNAVLRRVPSPDGHVQAVLFERNCGAASRTAYHVSIIDETAHDPAGVGNAFRFRDTVPPPITLLNTLDIRWVNNRALTIYYDPRAAVTKRASQTGGVRITYQAHEFH